MKPNITIPSKIKAVADTLERNGYSAYFVGGCVRDLLLSREPKDWDITTNASPEQIQSLFAHTFYENEYGTVGVVIDGQDATGTENSVGSHATNPSNVSRETHSRVTREPALDQMAELSHFKSSSIDYSPDAVVSTNSVTREPGPSLNSVATDVVTREPNTTQRPTVVEVTPYRKEGSYSDKRHPDNVSFEASLEEDLSRRDFTVNALAYSVSKGQIVDLHKGQDDVLKKTLRAVGEPRKRFEEDALRMLRAVRLASELNFAIEADTQEAIVVNAHLIKEIATERITDEFSKMLMSANPAPAMQICHQLGLLKYFIPELEEGIGIEQRGEHIYDVWEHNLRSLQHAANRGWSFNVRLAALLHDVAKPATRERDTTRNIWTFHGHDVVGAKMAKRIMQRLKFSRETTEVVVKLVRYHLFFSDVDKITLSAVRRMVRNVGPELVWELMKLRACDRIGTGRPKEAPYRLRKYEAMIEEAMRAPLTVGMLKIDGARLMAVTGETPGPRLGWTLHALLEEVLDNPELNTATYLETRALELMRLKTSELEALGEKGRERKGVHEQHEIGKIRRRHKVS
ncbi:MAG: hypothetical protein COV10_03615 [Candidatus Vogelbacteria bacterium CG10_big_fil_rev_8_21_14_0_10_51_16]|uniref:HD domain-containing protein n=1 Tax=Candidatus Vogelbacteria bacterium CG10_big_fil_rev_8_21_14_0_10_51_16 TaxID=1975045 RepID=A0A2H0RFI7_9BACT|nr:MAG: hypothetical protein COV10_03615 [Candidatus Vogelbacteria bacterium CG10_big_fil_rev_8_21_14_0_10_51_16]